METIIAQATPAGTSAIAIVRLSGKDAIKIAEIVCRTSLKKDRHLCNLFNDTDNAFDQALVSIFREPNSFTGENTVEFNCHGNQLIVQQLIEACLDHGARLAEAGEFSQRAFLNNKLELSQAEAIMELIHARSELLLFASSKQLLGSLNNKVTDLKSLLVNALGLIHGPMDFPIETEFEEIDFAKLASLIEETKTGLNKLINNAKTSSFLRNGLQTVILGKPNVGKSSLLNLLLNKERAIVSEEAGTTRDFISEEILLRDIPLVLIDTAGLRSKTVSQIEEAGIEKAKLLAKEAELIIFVYDASEGILDEDKALFKEAINSNPSAKFIVLANKCEQAKNKQKFADENLKSNYKIKEISFSVKKEIGLKELEDEIEQFVGTENKNNELEVAVNQRQLVFIKAAAKCLEEIDLQMPEVISLNLEEAINNLNQVAGNGKQATEKTMQAVFSNFCIGK